MKRPPIDPRTGRPCGDHGRHTDAIDFILQSPDLMAPGEETEFLKAWTHGDLDEWPEYYEWLARREAVFDVVNPGWRGDGPRLGFLSGVAMGVVALYLVTGLFMGYGMKRNIPAMNAAGVAYYTVTWPAFIASGAYGAPAPYVPSWSFTHDR